METNELSKSTAVSSSSESEKVRTAIEIAVRLGLLFLLVVLCLRIVAPFIMIVAWALIIAVAARQPYDRLCTLLGNRSGLAAAVFVLLVLLLTIVPAVMLSESLVSGAQHFAADIANDGLSVPPPPEKVASLPVVGPRLYDFWLLASKNLRQALLPLMPQLKAASRWLVSTAGSVGLAMIQLVVSLVIAGVMLAKSKGREETFERIGSRLAGERGEALMELSRSTIRSVVQGILGVALIQAVLAGISFIAVGVPGAGLWALLVLVAAVVQLPVTLVIIPPVLIVFSMKSSAIAIGFTVWIVLVSLIDNVLKPILFGRGVQIPMVIIFIGAIGGMLSMGVIGLFVGAVILAVGYEIFVDWLNSEEKEKS